MLYIPLYPTNLQIFGTKPLPRRRFLQHYYRNTFIESHRKPTDLPQISYGGRLICSMLALIPQSGDFSGAALGVRSFALIQVPKPTGNLVPFLAKSSKKSSISLLVLKKHLKNLRNSRKSATFAPAYYRCICKCDRCAL